MKKLYTYNILKKLALNFALEKNQPNKMKVFAGYWYDELEIPI